MTLTFLKRRLTRILSRPPEIAYAVWRQSWLIILLTLIGAGASYGWLKKRPLVYEGHAQIIVDLWGSAPGDLSVTRAPTGRVDRRQMTSLMEAQAAILMSDTVFDLLLDQLVENGTPLPGLLEAPASGDSDVGKMAWIGDVADRVHERIEGILDLGSARLPPDLDDAELVLQRQKAVGALKSRSRVAQYPSGAVDLFVYGTTYEGIKDQLRFWIIAYRTRLDEMAGENLDSRLDPQETRYSEQRAGAEAALGDFLAKENEKGEVYETWVSEAQLEDINHQIVQRQFERQELRSESRSSPTRYSEVESLKRQRDELELELNAKRLAGFGEQSTAVVDLQRRMGVLEEQIRVRTESEDSDADSVATAAESARSAQLARVRSELAGLLAAKARLMARLEERRELEANLEEAEEKLARFLQMRKEIDEDVETEADMKVKTADKPSVSLEPFGYRPFLTMGIGAGVGLVLATLLALLIEVLRGTTRFQHDLSSDFGLKVYPVRWK